MKLRFDHKHDRQDRGSTLVTTIAVLGVIGTMLAACLSLMNYRARATARSLSWNVCVPIAEAGLEEAMAHVQSIGRNRGFATNGWVLSSNVYIKTNRFADGYYIATITTNREPIIKSEGYVKLSATSAHIMRKFMLTTSATSGWRGLVAKNIVTMAGLSRVDSYDSSQSAYSTFGRYDPLKARDNGFLGSNSRNSDVLEIKDGANVLGSVGTGAPGGLKLVTPSSVGNALYVANPAHAGNVQGNHYETDLNESFPDNTVPFTAGFFTPSSGTFSGTNYTYLLNGGNYKVTGSLAIDTGQKLYVSQNSVLYVTDTFDLKGSGHLMIAAGVHLDLYVGNQFYATGDSLLNVNGTPDQFTCFGLPSNREVYLSGNAKVVGVFNTPQAKIDCSGDSYLSGAGVGESISLSGNHKFHYDEALGGGSGTPFTITGWWEL